MKYCIGQVLMSKGNWLTIAQIEYVTPYNGTWLYRLVNDESGKWYIESEIDRLFTAIPIATVIEQHSRWSKGTFTKEEIQNICHNLQGEKCAFYDGCAVQQKQLFGESEREILQKKIKELESRIEELENLAPNWP